MAKDSNREINELLVREIQCLEREKEELEQRSNKRQTLEQRVRELRSTVSSLRSDNKSTASTTDGRVSAETTQARTHLKSHQHYGDSDAGGFSELHSALKESQDNLRALSSHLLHSSTPSSSSGRRREDSINQTRVVSSESSAESDGGDDVMSQAHKQAIQENRDILVENLIPDDIFNDLISRKIFTTADVSRIKDRNTREAINEELLNHLCRRSDRAFYVFVQSLRRTLQDFLANRIDPQPSSRAHKKKRKRQTGELNISIDCDDVIPHATPARRRGRGRGNSMSRAQCSCQEVEEQILTMAKEAYRNIRRRDATPAAFEQFRKELQQTNEIIKDSMEIMHTLKILCRHGDLEAISEGSVQFWLRCHSQTDAQALWGMYVSGKLLRLFQRAFVTPSLQKRCRAQHIRLRVYIHEEEYLCCLAELSAQSDRNVRLGNKCAIGRSTTHSEPQKKRAKAVAYEKRSLDHYTRHLPRQAFQEISKNLKVHLDMSYEVEGSTGPASCMREKAGYNFRVRPVHICR